MATSDYTLLDTFSLDGRWGLPDWTVDKWIPGRLRFDPEAGISLELWGLVTELEAGPLPRIETYDAIWSLTQNAQTISLLG